MTKKAKNVLGKSVSVQETSDTVILHADSGIAASKMTIAGSGAIVSMLSLNTLIQIATLAFVIAQIGLLIPKYYALFKGWKRGKTIKVELD